MFVEGSYMVDEKQYRQKLDTSLETERENQNLILGLGQTFSRNGLMFLSYFPNYTCYYLLYFLKLTAFIESLKKHKLVL